MDRTEIRYQWFCSTGLDGSAQLLSTPEVLASNGWLRGVGGSTPYLGLYARCESHRSAIDSLVKENLVCELPSARGCTYVLPQQHFALGLAHARTALKANRRTAAKLGLNDFQIESQKEKVLKHLCDKTLSPAEIKVELGEIIVSFGEDGKKRGMSTSLPMVLGELQAEGKVRRIPVNGRLDQERYRYETWDPNGILYDGDADFDLIRLAVEWSGLVKVDDICWFTGLGKTKVKAAFSQLDLHEFAPDLFGQTEKFKSVPSEPIYSFVGAIDPLFNLCRNIGAFVEDEVLQWLQSHDVRLDGPLGLAFQAIVDRGRIIGLWDYDPEERELIYMTWTNPTKDLEVLAKKLECEIRDEIHDVRTHSLDSLKNRQKRFEFLRTFVQPISIFSSG